MPRVVPLAVEEMLRWTTPVVAFMRTTTVPTELGGQQLGAGDPVLMLYASANRDESVFGPTADRFDPGRDPNPHVAFGFGPHFCIGAVLARLEARILLEELLARFGSVESAGPVVRTASPETGASTCLATTGPAATSAAAGPTATEAVARDGFFRFGRLPLSTGGP